MTFIYTDNIPFSSNNPSSDQPNMQTNTNSIDNLIAVDHISFNLAHGGNHNLIHLNPQGTFPAPPLVQAGFGELYSQTVGTDQQLFYQSGNGIVTQLTGPNAPVASPNGYVFLAGGILLQWGFVNGTHGASHKFNDGDSTTIMFAAANIIFPNNCFNVTAQPLYNSSSATPNSQATIMIQQNSLSASSFTWKIRTGSSDYTAFFWLAIGN